MPSKFTTKMYGIGPVYIAIETQCKVAARFSPAWIKEVNEPYRAGHGWRVRLGHFALQFGRCTKHPEADESDDAHMAYLGMRYIPYLGEAVHDDAPGEGSDEGSGPYEVWLEGPESVLGDGVVAGRDLPGVQSFRVGPSATGGQEDGPQEGSADSNERWRLDYNTQATAQADQGD